MTRLENHKRTFEQNDRRGPLIRLDELTVEEVQVINSTFFERVQKDPPENIEDMYRIYIETLHEWGVMCPHPIERRRYSSCGRWYDCSLCQAAVVHS